MVLHFVKNVNESYCLNVLQCFGIEWVRSFLQIMIYHHRWQLLSKCGDIHPKFYNTTLLAVIDLKCGDELIIRRGEWVGGGTFVILRVAAHTQMTRSCSNYNYHTWGTWGNLYVKEVLAATIILVRCMP